MCQFSKGSIRCYLLPGLCKCTYEDALLGVASEVGLCPWNEGGKGDPGCQVPPWLCVLEVRGWENIFLFMGVSTAYQVSLGFGNLEKAN